MKQKRQRPLAEILKPKPVEEIEKDFLKLIETDPELFYKQVYAKSFVEQPFYRHIIMKHINLLKEKFVITIISDTIDVTGFGKEFKILQKDIYFKLKEK